MFDPIASLCFGRRDRLRGCLSLSLPEALAGNFGAGIKFYGLRRRGGPLFLNHEGERYWSDGLVVVVAVGGFVGGGRWESRECDQGAGQKELR